MATRSSSTLLADNTVQANFRAWAQFVEDTLVTTGGWVVTSDTGQTLPSALTVPGAANAKRGYRIYRMADALQATSPFYMRVDYGSGGATGNPGLWLTIGTGSDGSGNITGILWNGGAVTAANVSTQSTSTTQVNNSYGSASTNRVTLGMFIQAATTLPLVLSIERSKDASGADTGDGFLLCYSAAAARLERSRYIIAAGGAQPTEELGLGYLLTAQNPTQSFGANVGVGMVTHFKGIAQQPGMNLGVVGNNDVASETTFTMSIYGSNHTYLQLGSQIFPAVSVGGSSTQDSIKRLVMRYD